MYIKVWVNLHLVYPQSSRGAGAAPFSYSWLLWRHAQHSRSFPLTLQLLPLHFPPHWNLLSIIKFTFCFVTPVPLLESRQSRGTLGIMPLLSRRSWGCFILIFMEWFLVPYNRPSVCAQHVIEVIVSGMKVCIPHTFSGMKAWKPWFSWTSSCAVKDGGATHRLYYCLSPSEIYTLYISDRDHATFVLQLTKILSLIGRIKIFLTPTPLLTCNI